MKPKNVALILLLVSVCLTLYLISWCFVSWAPSMSRSKLQDIYTNIILSLGSVIALIQLAAMIAIFLDGKSNPDMKN